MRNTLLTQKAHARLLDLYQDFGEATRLRKRFLVARAYDALFSMEELLSSADSWNCWRKLKRPKKGRTNDEARNH